MTLFGKEEKVFVVIRGLPGSGKSSFAGLLKELWPSARIFETDDFWAERPFDKALIGEAHRWNRERMCKELQTGSKLVILANTSSREWEFQDIVDEADSCGYAVFSIIVENRHGNHSIHKVPAAVVAGMERTFEIRLAGKTRPFVSPGLWSRFKRWLDS